MWVDRCLRRVVGYLLFVAFLVLLVMRRLLRWSLFVGCLIVGRCLLCDVYCVLFVCSCSLRVGCRLCFVGGC